MDNKKKLIVVVACTFFLAASLILLVHQTQTNHQISNSSASTGFSPLPITCGVNDPPIKLIGQKEMGVVAAGSSIDFDLTFANCSGNTLLQSNTFLVASNLDNNTIWGTTAFQLTSDLPTSNSLRMILHLTVPQNNGNYVLGFGVTSNGHKIFPNLTPQLVFVGTPIVCNASTTGDAQPSIQNCINQASNYSIIELPTGTYTLNEQLYITKPIILTTEGTENLAGTCQLTLNLNCATLIAGPSFQGNPSLTDPFYKYTLVNVTGNSMGIKHIVFDGNRNNRNVASLCTQANNLKNTVLLTGNNAHVFDSAIVNTPCGAGVLTEGGYNTLVGNYVAYNGKLDGTYHWSDGMGFTARYSTIMNNFIRDNTDVDLIIRNDTQSNVNFNTIIHDQDDQESGAALMLDTYEDGQSGVDHLPNDPGLTASFTGADISYNTVSCNSKCGFGIMLGFKDWQNPNSNLNKTPYQYSIYGGDVHNNFVDGAIQGINIFGAGMTGAPVKMGYNVVTNSGGYALSGGTLTKTNGFNQDPTDLISYYGGQAPITAQTLNIVPACYYSRTPYCTVSHTACTSFNYSDFSSCNYELQVRSSTSQLPVSCVGGIPILNQDCVTPSPTISPTSIPTTTPIVTATPKIAPTVTPTATPSPVPTVTGTNTISFKLKLQGMNNLGRDMTAHVSMGNINNQAVTIHSDTNGNYSGSVSGVTLGNNSLHIKVDYYLSKTFNIGTTSNVDLTSTPLLAGDFDNDNKIDITDIALILSKYTNLAVSVNNSNQIYDINNDGTIDISDVSLILSNYTQLSLSGN